MKKTWKTINSIISKKVYQIIIKKIIYNNIEFNLKKKKTDVLNTYLCSVGNDLDACTHSI